MRLQKEIVIDYIKHGVMLCRRAAFNVLSRKPLLTETEILGNFVKSFASYVSADQAVRQEHESDAAAKAQKINTELGKVRDRVAPEFGGVLKLLESLPADSGKTFRASCDFVSHAGWASNDVNAVQFTLTYLTEEQHNEVKDSLKERISTAVKDASGLLALRIMVPPYGRIVIEDYTKPFSMGAKSTTFFPYDTTTKSVSTMPRTIAAWAAKVAPGRLQALEEAFAKLKTTPPPPPKATP